MDGVVVKRGGRTTRSFKLGEPVCACGALSSGRGTPPYVYARSCTAVEIATHRLLVPET